MNLAASPKHTDQVAQKKLQSPINFSPPAPQRIRIAPPVAPRRSATMPAPDVEPLTFAKVPIARPSASTLLNMSTDTEVTSDCGEQLSRSPSLLTSLIQSSRIVSASSSVANSPNSSSHFSSLPHAKPILRRVSSGQTSAITSGDEQSDLERSKSRAKPSLAIALGQRLEPLAERQGSPEPAHRRTRLKFAVTPRPLQLASACSSRRASPEPSFSDEDDYDDEDLATPGFYSDSDNGYQEDSEDGFTDDDEPFLPPAHWGQRRPSWTPYRAPSAPILQVSAKPECRGRIRIDDDRSAIKCSRHRSPPPEARMRAREAAPPAARSPSAYELCRRRGSTGQRPFLGYSGPKPQPPSQSRGWRSDDARPQPQPSTGAQGVQAQRARSLTHKTSAKELSRRDSAPARVDEVHAAGETECSHPKGGLRKVLTAFR